MLHEEQPCKHSGSLMTVPLRVFSNFGRYKSLPSYECSNWIFKIYIHLLQSYAFSWSPLVYFIPFRHATSEVSEHQSQHPQRCPQVCVGQPDLPGGARHVPQQHRQWQAQVWPMGRGVRGSPPQPDVPQSGPQSTVWYPS